MVSFCPLDGVRGLRPAMAVRRGQDGRFKIDPEVVPIAVRTVSAFVGQVLLFEKRAEAVRLDRSEKTKGAALILAKLTAGDRAEEGSHRRMQRPASVQALGEGFHADGGSPGRHRGRDGSGVGSIGLRAGVRFDRAADQLNDLVACRDQRNVRVAALDLCPVVA